jgi:hypothetical protein
MALRATRDGDSARLSLAPVGWMARTDDGHTRTLQFGISVWNSEPKRARRCLWVPDSEPNKAQGGSLAARVVALRSSRPSVVSLGDYRVPEKIRFSGDRGGCGRCAPVGEV